MKIINNISYLKRRIVKVLIKHGVKKIAIFGSYARGDAKRGSDIDIIVEFSKRKSLLDIVGIEQELSDILDVKVDLLTEKSISPYLIESIRREMIEIYK